MIWKYTKGNVKLQVSWCFLAIRPLCLFTLITSYQIHVEVHWLYSIRFICYVLSYFPTDRVCWDFVLFEGGLSFLLSPSACSKKGPLIIGVFFVLFWVFSYILKCFEVTVFVIWRYTNIIELNMSIWAQDVGSRSTGKSTMMEPCCIKIVIMQRKWDVEA